MANWKFFFLAVGLILSCVSSDDNQTSTNLMSHDVSLTTSASASTTMETTTTTNTTDLTSTEDDDITTIFTVTVDLTSTEDYMYNTTTTVTATTKADLTSTEDDDITTTFTAKADLTSTKDDAITTTAATKADLTSTENVPSRVLSSSTQSPTGSYSVSESGDNNDNNDSNSSDIDLIVGIVVGVCGGIALLIMAVLIGITIHRRREGNRYRVASRSVSVTSQNPNLENEHSYGNVMIEPDDFFHKQTTFVQPHLVDPHKDPATDGTYIGLTTMQHDADKDQNLENQVYSNSEFNPADPESSIVQVKIDGIDNFTPIENDTILVENDLYVSKTENLNPAENDTILVENDLYVSKTENLNPAECDTILVENNLYAS